MFFFVVFVRHIHPGAPLFVPGECHASRVFFFLSHSDFPRMQPRARTPPLSCADAYLYTPCTRARRIIPPAVRVTVSLSPGNTTKVCNLDLL